MEAAERCALETGTQYRPGRGGQRRAGQVTAEVQLIKTIIESYALLRNKFPSSGPRRASRRTLMQFVRSALRLVDPYLAEPTRITDEAIRGAFNRGTNQRQNRN